MGNFDKIIIVATNTLNQHRSDLVNACYQDQFRRNEILAITAGQLRSRLQRGDSSLPGHQT